MKYNILAFTLSLVITYSILTWMRNRQESVHHPDWVYPGQVVTNMILLQVPAHIPFKFSEEAESEIRRMCHEEIEKDSVKKMPPGIQYYNGPIHGWYLTNSLDASTMSNIMRHAYQQHWQTDIDPGIIIPSDGLQPRYTNSFYIESLKPGESVTVPLILNNK